MHVGSSSPTRDRTLGLLHWECSLTHWTTREVPPMFNFDNVQFSCIFSIKAYLKPFLLACWKKCLIYPDIWPWFRTSHLRIYIFQFWETSYFFDNFFLFRSLISLWNSCKLYIWSPGLSLWFSNFITFCHFPPSSYFWDISSTLLATF